MRSSGHPSFEERASFGRCWFVPVASHGPHHARSPSRVSDAGVPTRSPPQPGTSQARCVSAIAEPGQIEVAFGVPGTAEHHPAQARPVSRFVPARAYGHWPRRTKRRRRFDEPVHFVEQGWQSLHFVDAPACKNRRQSSQESGGQVALEDGPSSRSAVRRGMRISPVPTNPRMPKEEALIGRRQEARIGLA